MKFCVPIKENLGLNSVICENFESAEEYICYNLDKDDYTILSNQDIMSSGLSLSEHDIEVIVCVDIRLSAAILLKRKNIKIFCSKPDSQINDIIASIKQSNLPEYDYNAISGKPMGVCGTCNKVDSCSGKCSD